jgi:hypothetical protein
MTSLSTTPEHRFELVRPESKIGAQHTPGVMLLLQGSSFQEPRASEIRSKPFFVEVKMARAAVGLFEKSQSVDGIIHDLEASGFPRNDIRVLSEPEDMGGSGMMSTAHTDFEVDFIRELRTAGAAEADAEAYVKGLRGGGVIVFASGSDEKVDTAAEIMNRHCAIELEELRASEPHLHSSMTSGRSNSGQTGRIRSSGGGARLFVW